MTSNQLNVTMSMQQFIDGFCSSISREGMSYSTSTNIIKKQLKYEDGELEFILHEAVRKSTDNKRASCIQTSMTKLAQKICRYLSQIFKEVTSNPEGPLPINHSRQLSVRIGYLATCLCQLLFLSIEIYRLVLCHRYEQALDKFKCKTTHRSHSTLESFVYRYVMCRLRTAILILHLQLRKEHVEEISQVIAMREKIRTESDRIPVDQFNKLTLVLCLVQVKMAARQNKLHIVSALLLQYGGQNPPFGKKYTKVFKGESSKMYSKQIALNQWSDQDVREEKPISLSRSRILKKSLEKVQMKTVHKSRRQSSRMDDTPKKLQLGNFLELFRSKSTVKAKESRQRIYSAVKAINVAKVSVEEIKNELQNIRSLTKVKKQENYSQIEASRKGKQIKKSKLCIFRRLRHNDASQGSVIHSGVLKFDMKKQMRFVMDSINRIRLFTMDLEEENQDLFMLVRCQQFTFRFRIRKQQSEVNKNYMTQWPDAKHLFRKWFNRNPNLKSIQTNMSIQQYDIDISSVPAEMRLLKKQQLFIMAELRDITRTFVKLTMFLKKKPNGIISILTNKIPATKLNSKIKIKKLSVHKQLQLDVDQLKQLLLLYDDPVLLYALIMQENRFVLVTFTLDVRNFVQHLTKNAQIGYLGEYVLFNAYVDGQKLEHGVKVPRQTLEKAGILTMFLYYCIQNTVLGAVSSLTTKWLVQFVSKFRLSRGMLINQIEDATPFPPFLKYQSEIEQNQPKLPQVFDLFDELEKQAKANLDKRIKITYHQQRVFEKYHKGTHSTSLSETIVKYDPLIAKEFLTLVRVRQRKMTLKTVFMKDKKSDGSWLVRLELEKDQVKKWTNIVSQTDLQTYFAFTLDQHQLEAAATILANSIFLDGCRVYSNVCFRISNRWTLRQADIDRGASLHIGRWGQCQLLVPTKSHRTFLCSKVLQCDYAIIMVYLLENARNCYEVNIYFPLAKILLFQQFCIDHDKLAKTSPHDYDCRPRPYNFSKYLWKSLLNKTISLESSVVHIYKMSINLRQRILNKNYIRTDPAGQKQISVTISLRHSMLQIDIQQNSSFLSHQISESELLHLYRTTNQAAKKVTRSDLARYICHRIYGCELEIADKLQDDSLY